VAALHVFVWELTWIVYVDTCVDNMCYGMIFAWHKVDGFIILICY